MLTVLAEQPECLWDETLPIEVKELPEDLAALDRLLSEPELLWRLVSAALPADECKNHYTTEVDLTDGWAAKPTPSRQPTVPKPCA